MATGLITAAANTQLDALGTTYRWVQLHVGDPGAAGTANVAAETDRIQATYAAAAGGAKATSADLLWEAVAGAEDYSHFSVWTAATAGSCGFTGTVSANAVQIGDNFRIPAGDLALAFTVAS